LAIHIRKVHGICPLNRTNCIFTLLQDERSFVAIKYLSGDLFENRFGAEAFGHGCNLQGSMGAALERMKRQADEKGIRTVAIPRIVTAYGGLSAKRFAQSLSGYLTIGQERCMFMRSMFRGITGKVNRVIPS
jgi:hypothetical protein